MVTWFQVLSLDNDLKIATVTGLCGISKLSKAERIFLDNQYYDKEVNQKETDKVLYSPMEQQCGS